MPVSQVEVGAGGDPLVYFPDTSDPQFAGKIITDRSGTSAGNISAHATSIGRRFYGLTSSIAPQITLVDVHEANYWIQPDFLRWGGNFKPLVSSSRVANHSWVGNFDVPADDVDVLRRVDWVIETDEYVQVVGSKNNTGINRNLLSNGFNVIAVGRTDGQHGTGTTALDADYTAGRVKPDIVVPLTTTSSATAVVSAAAALLIETGHALPVLSGDPVEQSTTNRNGDLLYNAERSETVRAILMAGADRYTSNTAAGNDIHDYRANQENRTANGLDTRFGAGQVNIYNSYQILAAGEQNSAEDDAAGGGSIGIRGFDYDPAFGGSGGSNSVASYYFSSGASPAVFKATVVWNLDISGGGGQLFDGTSVLHDQDLHLYDVTGPRVSVASSAGTLDNTESVWVPLSPGRSYLLQVSVKGGFEWDYGLAWHIESDTDGDTIVDVHDNCPGMENIDQLDTDADGEGDVCDIDDDNDLVPDTSDQCPGTPSGETVNSYGCSDSQIDTDGDGVMDAWDNCIEVANPDQRDTSNDGYGNLCDADFNGDLLTNIGDLVYFKSVFGTGDPDGDLDGNGAINIGDLVIFKGLFGVSPGPSCCGATLP